MTTGKYAWIEMSVAHYGFFHKISPLPSFASGLMMMGVKTNLCFCQFQWKNVYVNKRSSNDETWNLRRV